MEDENVIDAKGYIRDKTPQLRWTNQWVLISSTGEVSYSCIRDLGFNLRLYQKLMVSWSDNKELSSGADAIG